MSVMPCNAWHAYVFVYCCEFMSGVSLSKHGAIPQITRSWRRAVAVAGDMPS